MKGGLNGGFNDSLKSGLNGSLKDSFTSRGSSRIPSWFSSSRLAWAFLAIAGSVFVIRGPARATWWSDDFAVPYSMSRAWLLGTNPYQPDSLNRVLIDAGRERDSTGRAINNSPVYLPPTLVPHAPVTLLPWRAARIAWLALNLLLVGWMIRSALLFAGVRWGETPALWLAGAIVALAPLHTGIAVGQIAIPSIALAIVAMSLIRDGRQNAGGIALGVSVLLKPQLTGPFIAYYFLRRGQRAAAVATAVGVAAAIVSLGWLWMNDIPWLESWRAVMQSIMVPGSQHDPAGPWSAQLVELRTLITALGGGEWAGIMGFGIAALAGVWLYAVGRRLDERHDLLLLSGVAVLSLLATYHRFYDAGLLAVPLVWLAYGSRLSAFGVDPRLSAAALGCIAIFFVPGAWAMQRLADAGRLPAALTESWVWNAVLLRHQNWALVILFVVLAAALVRARRLPAPPSVGPT